MDHTRFGLIRKGIDALQRGVHNYAIMTTCDLSPGIITIKECHRLFLFPVEPFFFKFRCILHRIFFLVWAIYNRRKGYVQNLPNFRGSK